MKCLKKFIILTLTFLFVVNAAEIKIEEQLKAMAEQIEIMKTQHKADINILKKEIEELKNKPTVPITDNHQRNEQLTLQWAKTSMHEIRVEMRELHERINNSVLLYELNVIRNELRQALNENKDLAQFARIQEARVDKLDNEAGRLKHECLQLRSMIVEQRTHIGKLVKDIKSKEINELTPDGYNEVMVPREVPCKLKSHHGHKYRHDKMIHTQIARLARSQDQLDEYQQSLQMQLLDVQRRLDRFEEANWNLLSTKVEFLEIESKNLNDGLKNVSQKVSDFDKFHVSILQLREDIESIENKADKIIPEFRKEISKLDLNYAQLNAHYSYLKEDQENLRQSVKAIAVSVSNTIDRTDSDRVLIKRINTSVYDLETRSKQHYHRLNDHILKSEAVNLDSNITGTVLLPDLMDEVKQLQPVKREYEDLVNQLPKDCSNISGPAGVYLIHPGHAPLETWCANRSTIIQRRFNGTVDFNRKFSEYVNGFGDPASEYWLGLEAMHVLTSDNCFSMRIDMTDIYGGSWYAQYDHFSVGNESSGFVLNVGGFKGNASDAFEYQNNMEFSAIDRDRDTSNTHCASNYEGGWWFSHCQHVNINGKYTLGLTWFDAARNQWIAVATSEMRMYRRPGCS